MHINTVQEGAKRVESGSCQRLAMHLSPNLCKSLSQHRRWIHTAKLWVQKTLCYLTTVNWPICHSFFLTLGEHFEKYMKNLRMQIFLSFKLKNSQNVRSQSQILNRVSLVCLCTVHIITVPYFSVSYHNILAFLHHFKSCTISLTSQIVIITRKYWESIRHLRNFWFKVCILFVMSRDVFLCLRKITKGKPLSERQHITAGWLLGREKKALTSPLTKY